MNPIIDFLFSIVSGLISAAIILWFVERQRRPKLSFHITSSDRHSSGRIHLHITVRNERMTWPVSLIYGRSVAEYCQAWISFYYDDGVRVYPSEMRGRWSETPEPLSIMVDSSGKRTWTYDPTRRQDWVNIPSDSGSQLDIAFRYENENECFGWNSEGYEFPPDLKNPNWQLGKGRYLIKVRVKTPSVEFRECFLLINDMDFRLETLTDKNLKKRLLG